MRGLPRAIAYEKFGRWFDAEEPLLRAKERTDAGSSPFRHPRSELIAPLLQEAPSAFNNRKLHMRLPCLSEVTMPAKRYKVTLESDERGDLEKLISRGKGAARRLAHARILLHADQGEGRPGRIDAEIAEAVGVSVTTIERVRQRFVEEG